MAATNGSYADEIEVVTDPDCSSISGSAAAGAGAAGENRRGSRGSVSSKGSISAGPTPRKSTPKAAATTPRAARSLPKVYSVSFKVSGGAEAYMHEPGYWVHARVHGCSVQ